MGDDQAAAASFGVMYRMLLHDGLIFTVGIGKHVRAMAAQRLDSLDVKVPHDASARIASIIRMPWDLVQVRAMLPDEDAVITRHARTRSGRFRPPCETDQCARLPGVVHRARKNPWGE
jgi:acetate kinase